MNHIGTPDPHWRMFPINDQHTLLKLNALEITRMHFMQTSALSFGFVEQRVLRTEPPTELAEQALWFLYAPNIRYEPVSSLREGMDIIEWMWNEGVEKT